MIKVLIVDDSAVAREFLAHILGADPEIEIIGTVCNGLEAVNAAVLYKPDVITMDINMPVMNGYEATRRIMERQPTPIVVVSSAVDPGESRASFQALQAGALTVLPRPPGMGHRDFENEARTLVSTVKTIAGVHMMRISRPALPPPSIPGTTASFSAIQMIVVGASTGGPIALAEMLKNLPLTLPVPIAVVQHIAPGFCESFIEWLSQSTGWPVHAASQGLTLLPGHVYVAPDGKHLELAPGPRASLNYAPPDAGLRPSVKRLFQSAAMTFRDRVAAVLLTGMGRDGAEEMCVLRNLGALTLAQDESSSVVFGMPGEAVKLGGAVYVLSPEQIAKQLTKSFYTNP